VPAGLQGGRPEDYAKYKTDTEKSANYVKKGLEQTGNEVAKTAASYEGG